MAADHKNNKKAGGPPKPPSIPAPSASVVVISPQNEILLLHRRQSGTFSSAHVFPGGNLSPFHEGSTTPAVDSPERHVDGPAYRMAAIRETFEESGVLLARAAGQAAAAPTENRALLQVEEAASKTARVGVANDKVRFEDWLASVGGIADCENLIPFTRWLTPPNLKRRYTTQMYLYFLPLVDHTKTTSAAGAAAGMDSNSNNSNKNGGASADQTEVTEATWASAATWIGRARNNDIILFPPQLYILSLLAPLLQGPAALSAGNADVSPAEHYAAERRKVAAFLHDGPAPGEDKATFVPWADRVISPRVAGKLADDARGRSVMTLDYPGPELKNSGRGGDSYRVVVVGNLPPGPPRDLELALRADVMPQVVAKPKIQATGRL
ncbi:hypothetical protein HMPREF1624_08784 [Sporothrix schenckii ATCC 58251]|uniref:Nudix hydrolase domain-containing protein n=1 Tax=Sporothrix schenckii (strain ATCC 58251 / de Perez 2211183) TaxID=1391915 RepID=U7PJ12_SPOS1|nr:hypothetical protein HMPREF1624_08784 [Sporothrix schenckii ATCC 58251]